MQYRNWLSGFSEAYNPGTLSVYGVDTTPYDSNRYDWSSTMLPDTSFYQTANYYPSTFGEAPVFNHSATYNEYPSYLHYQARRPAYGTREYKMALAALEYQNKRRLMRAAQARYEQHGHW